ncbi:tetratricopeptide repeat protein [Marimonas arenosa]|uniref:Tetratricopeptide repeat protein n=1 Tax=Marimonas arenosa TaxID=1795305 RepID=A0AAE3WBI5_9RHOB|nr:tetratricopeptide repeat protein [Marimonas arenosa]MDQ2089664.1 tetratricopeptide repeat protein [Marimonas arenosa]
MLKRAVVILTLFLGAGLLAGCDSAEERAEEHFEKGMELLEAGDTDRALVEFRNVFKLNGYHRDARLAYAQVEEQRGNISSAYGQYLRLVEQYPEDLDGRRALARLALETGNWEEVERHVVVAKKLAPDDPIVRAVGTAFDYRKALLDQDPAAAGAAVAVAQELVKTDPSLMNARRVVIDNLIRRQDWPDALVAIDEALAVNPDSRTLHNLQLISLEQLGREDEIEAHLKMMAERYPEDKSIHRQLIGWFVARERIADAEDYLRSRIALDDEAVEGYVVLVGFLAQYVSPDAARAEIERILSETEADPALFRSIRAGLDFNAGKQDAAIAEMEDILQGAEPSDQTRRIKIALANMLIRTGNSVGARAQVEEVLNEDPTHVSALKLKAGWLIDDDHTGDAIVELRRALDQSPRDAEVLTLLARAYERAGNRELMNEMLALAVEASNSAPPEALRYARVLLRDEKLLSAEDILLDALRLKRDNPELLEALGNVYVRMEDWSRSDHVIDTLTRLGTVESRAAANELTARKLAGQNRETELGAFLDQLAEVDGGLRSVAAVVRLRLANGDVQGALEYVNEQLEADPENPALRFVAATVLAIEGQVETAESMFRELLEESPNRENIWVALYNLHRSRGENEAAAAVLSEGLEVLPESANLNWVQAGEFESRGDIEKAISIYETLYERNSNSQVIANNLASLISSYRDDDESLERAFTIARRLRGTKAAPFQDTYGWIAYRLGNHEEALEYLKPASEGLPEDPLVQYHLAMVYSALTQQTEALAKLREAVELIEESGRRPEILDKVKAEIVRLEAEVPADN